MAQNELQLVTFEQAKRLKAVGFDWETTYNYSTLYGTEEELLFMFSKVLQRVPVPLNWNSTDVVRQDAFSAPTVALALKWFRDVKGVTTTISFCHDEYLDEYEDDGAYYGYRGKREKRFSCVQVSIGDSYEEAESALLDALLTKLEAS